MTIPYHLCKFLHEMHKMSILWINVTFKIQVFKWIYWNCNAIMIVRFKEKITTKSELISFPKNACRNITRKAKDINSISIGKEHKMQQKICYK